MEPQSYLGRRDLWRDVSRGQLAKEGLLRFRSESLDPRDNANLMPAGSQGFHEQPIRFIAAAVRRIVKRIVRQQDSHYFEERSRRRRARSARLAGESSGERRSLGAVVCRNMSSNCEARKPLTKRSAACRDISDSRQSIS